MSTNVSVVPTHNSIAIDFREWLGPSYGSISMASIHDAPPMDPISQGRPLTIAISREIGTPASTTAVRLGERLGWHVYDRELIEQIAGDMHLPAHLLHGVDEHPQSWLTEALGAFLSPAWRPTLKTWVSEDAFVHSVVKTIRRIGAQRRSVIVGRGSVFILPPESTLRVRLIAPVADRVANLCEQAGISKELAKRNIADTDRQQREFVQKHFHQDPAEPRHYDLVINCGRFDVDAQVDQIYQAMCQLNVHAAARELSADT